MSAPTDGPALVILGYYGKLPSFGDFIDRRLPYVTMGIWDCWLRAAIAASNDALGADWMPRYLVSPIWRFILPTGICGEVGWAGVMMPSVDRVGRAFPLMMATALAEGATPSAVLDGGQSWFEAVEDRALAALDAGFTLDRLDEPIAALTLGPPRPQSFAQPCSVGAIGRYFSLEGFDDLGAFAPAIPGAASRTMWWTTGATNIAPVLLNAEGLPAPEGFAALIDGDWVGHGWRAGSPSDRAVSTAMITRAPAPSEPDFSAREREE